MVNLRFNKSSYLSGKVWVVTWLRAEWIEIPHRDNKLPGHAADWRLSVQYSIFKVKDRPQSHINEFLARIYYLNVHHHIFTNDIEHTTSPLL